MQIIRSSRDEKERFSSVAPVPLRQGVPFVGRLVWVDFASPRQKILGFGGAITESSAYVLSTMDPQTRMSVLQDYYGKDGIGYSLGRLCLNSSDFALENYDYLPEGARTIERFSLAREDRWLVPTLQDIIHLRGEPLTLLVSPWSPCAFMKSNHEMNHGGHLLPTYYRLWSEYEAKYVEEMRYRGIEISMISVQNEPEASQAWDSCLFSAEEEAAYIPFLRRALDARGFANVGIFIWDHNRDEMVRRANTTLFDPGIDKMVSGIAFHWYCSDAYENVELTHRLHPNKRLLFTEGCVETAKTGLLSDPETLWSHGEKYGRSMGEDLNHFAEGWIDWNIILDARGGPNHANNFCEAPILYDSKKGTLTKNPSFYFIGHYAKYVKPGAICLSCPNDFGGGLVSSGFLNGDGSLAVVVQNEGKDATFTLLIKERKAITFAPAHSITTYLFDKSELS